jgi:Cu+-exporting ATPase
VLDKTGTITAGKPALTDIHPTGPWDREELLRLIAAAETDSEHPIAAATVAGARDRGLTIPPASGFESVTGKGVRATVAGHPVLVGTARLLADAGIDTTALEDTAAGLSADGKTPVLAAIDAQPAGVLAIADPVKADSAAAIAALHHLGVEVVMLTGDNATTALAAADVGLAIGTGTDVAIEAADITLISGSLAGVVTALSLSRATMRNIRQNLFFALAYNGIGIPVAAGALYPAFGIRLSPIIAAAAMAASSLSVVGNANRLRRYHPAPLPPAGPIYTEPRVETPADRAGDGQAPSTAVTDPVCGMTVDPATSAARRSSGQGTVYFCSQSCASAFDASARRGAAVATVNAPGAGTRRSG